MGATQEKDTFQATYAWAKSWHELPWAHDEPTLFLAEAIQRRPPGRALDIGCGAGTDSVYLARHGWDVTALDFMPKALEYTMARAREAGVSVTPVEADITTWQPDGRYDLVLDHGLLHNVVPAHHAAYRQRVLDTLADEGDFILLHWHPRYSGQANGRMGPRRASRAEIRDFFAPELQERYHAREEFEDLPDIVGGGMAQAYYWFRRNPAVHRPQQLLAQLRATLSRHGIDPDAQVPAADPLPDGLLARIVGPGRLGLSHQEELDDAAAAARLAEWARAAGEAPHAVGQLLGLFAGDAHAAVCVAAAPRCTVCDVRCCKRLRHR